MKHQKNQRNKKKIFLVATFSIILILAIIILVVFLTPSPDVSGKSKDSDDSDEISNPKNYWNEFPEWWVQVSAPIMGDNILEAYQGFVAGDLYGNGTPAYIGAISHGVGGIYLQFNKSGNWDQKPLTPYYDEQERKDYYCQKSMRGYDFDKDGSLEMVTGADKVRFFNTSEDKRRFAGLMYIDLSTADGSIITQPLIWGKWGENVTSEDFTNFFPIPVDPRFKNQTNTLPGILVSSRTTLNHTVNGTTRLLFIEQPDCGFANINYTYTSPGVQGTYPYAKEPSYLKHLYVNDSDTLNEMRWSPGDCLGSDFAHGILPTTVDFNKDGWLDLIVGIEYFKYDSGWTGDILLESRIEVYLRQPFSLEEEYVFEKNQTIILPNYGTQDFVPIDLDGNLSTGFKGKESVLMEVARDYKEIPTQQEVPSGFAVGRWNGTGLEIEGLDGVDFNEWPYFRSGYALRAYDVNNDNFEDAIVNLCHYNFQDNVHLSDIFVFFNPNNVSTKGDLPFIYNEKYAKKLLWNQSLTYTMQLCDANLDGKMDLITANCISTPHWDPSKTPIKAAYYCSLEQNWDLFSN